jgi:hypothetical protein
MHIEQWTELIPPYKLLRESASRSSLSSITNLVRDWKLSLNWFMSLVFSFLFFLCSLILPLRYSCFLFLKCLLFPRLILLPYLSEFGFRYPKLVNFYTCLWSKNWAFFLQPGFKLLSLSPSWCALSDVPVSHPQLPQAFLMSLLWSGFYKSKRMFVFSVLYCSLT